MIVSLHYTVRPPPKTSFSDKKSLFTTLMLTTSLLFPQAPGCLLDLLDINYDVELLLRTVTFLANVMAILQERDLSPSNLPPDEKAPSPETLFSALMALDRRDALRNKVFRLTRHDSTDIQYQASRLYGYVTSSK